MMNVNKNIYQLITIFCMLYWPVQTNAYIDPGTGSLILQGIIAGIAMGLYTIKMYWYKIKSFFKIGNENTDDEANDDNE